MSLRPEVLVVLRRLTRFQLRIETIPRAGAIALLVASLGFVWVFWANAWVGDDAYITLRTVDNFVNGHGLRWNLGERVQTYTHPLWLLLLSAGYFLKPDAYFVALSASLLSCVVMLGITGVRLWRVSPMRPAALTLLLISSKAFVDYTTSGLENPLSYAILVAFYCTFLLSGWRTIVPPFLLAALAFLNRQDTVLLFLPALVYVTVEQRRQPLPRLLGGMLLGLSPAVAWEIFSFVYYGFPFPNTAYAKLATGLPVRELLWQGQWYFWNSLSWDSVTLVLIFAAVAWTMARSSGRFRVAAVGPLLYMAYIWSIGGDFMSGRFFALPYLLSCLLLVAAPKAGRLVTGALILAAVLTLWSPTAPIKSGPGYRSLEIDEHGITDERGWYWEGSALCLYRRDALHYPNHYNYFRGLTFRHMSMEFVVYTDLGYFGYAAGPEKTILDPWAISDVLLARLPVTANVAWRPGHFQRDLPVGYSATVATGHNKLEDPDLRRYYEQLQTLTREPVLAPGRLSEIVRFHTGRYDQFLDRYLERQGNTARPRPWLHSVDWDLP